MNPPATEPTLAARHAARVRGGELNEDPGQRELIRRFERLERDLRTATPRQGLVARLLRRPDAPPRGLYVYGEVGRGKTLVMDEFFATTAALPKRRTHFNEFMGDVQDRLHAARSATDGKGSDDPIDMVAAGIAGETRLLCLDEFTVTDIADAMILSRLFAGLFARGLVLVATSNSAPEDLYRDGLNRGLFLPFVDLLKSRVDVLHLDAGTDYRLAKLAGAPVYVTPLGPGARAALDTLWRRLTGTTRGAATALRTHGRDISIPQAEDGVARFSFAELCEAPLAANDYLQIARTFHTVMVDDIPVIADAKRDAARRLILLVDTLYDHRVNLILSAAAEPAALYTAVDGEEAFAFKRTISRLIEMRSAAYLGAAHGATQPPLAPQH